VLLDPLCLGGPHNLLLRQTAAALWFLEVYRLSARPPLLRFPVRLQKLPSALLFGIIAE
jgi:hypothetical protein